VKSQSFCTFAYVEHGREICR